MKIIITENQLKKISKFLLKESFNRNQIFYHGTKTKFDKFDQNKIGSSTDNGWWGRGFYFHSEPDRGGYGNIIIAAKLDLKNPYILPSDNGQSVFRIIKNFIDINPNLEYKGAMNIIRAVGPGQFTKILIESGYDGVVVNYVEGTTEVVVFNANDIYIVS